MPDIPLTRVPGGLADCTLCKLYNPWQERCEKPADKPCPHVVVQDDDGEIG